MGLPPEAHKGPVPHAQTFLAVFEYWRDLNPSRPLRTIVEFEAGAEAFDRFIQRPVAQLDRRLVAAYRDALLARSLHPKTVTNKLSHISAMLQAAVDAGLYPANPIRGLRVPQSEGLNIGRRHSPLPSCRRFLPRPCTPKVFEREGAAARLAFGCPRLVCSQDAGSRSCAVCVQRTPLDTWNGSQVLGTRALVFAQLCGSNSLRRLLGQVGSFVSTSLR